MIALDNNWAHIDVTAPIMKVSDLVRLIERGFIDFDTHYQNSALWNEVQQSYLIETMLLGLQLPSFYFEQITLRDWKILDGFQRCITIRNFVVEGALILDGLEILTGYNGKKYNDLEFRIKRDFLTLPVSVNILEKITPDGLRGIIVKRLNATH